MEGPEASGVAGVSPLWALGVGSLGMGMDTQVPPDMTLTPLVSTEIYCPSH